MKNKWKKAWELFKRPPAWALWILYPLTLLFCGGAITLVVVGSNSPALEILSYIAYALAACTLGYSTYTVVRLAPTIKGNITAWIKRSPFGARMLENYGFRTVIFAACSTLVNLAYVGFHIFLAISLRSYWYGSLALYYGTLVALRGGLVLFHRKRRGQVRDERENRRVEIRKYRTCGILLTIIPLTLLVPILQIVFLDKAFFKHGMIMVIAFAAYAFYKIIMAIYNLVKVRKEKDLTVQAVRCVGFADALTSIFSLQTALLFAVGEGSGKFANVATGSVACLLTIALGVGMIWRASRKKKEWRET